MMAEKGGIPVEKPYEDLMPFHWELMEKAEEGFHWDWHKDDDTDSMLRYLMNIGYIGPREDIAPGFLRLTESGKIALYHYRQDRRKEAERQRKEEDAEAKRLQERAQDQADAERRYKNQNKVAIAAAFISGSLGFILGVLTEHSFAIVQFLFQHP